MKNFNAQDMKSINRKIILDTIRDVEVSRADLARITGLTRAGITVIINDLIQQNYIVEGEPNKNGKKGRNATTLSINGNKCFCIGINITRFGVCMGVCDYLGKAKCQDDKSFLSAENKLKILEYIDEIINKYFLQFGYSNFLGIGLTTPGPVDSTKGIILNAPNFKDWNNFCIIDFFEKKYRIKTVLENFSNGITLYEKNNGVGKNLHNFIGFVIDNGIGSSVILDDKIYNGKNGIGVELGHCSIDFNGKVCSCGNKGCVELYASITNIIAFAKSIDSKYVDWRTIVDYAEIGEKNAVDIIEQESIYLSAMIVNCGNSFDVSEFVFFGELTYKNYLLSDKILDKISKQIINRSISQPQLYFSLFNDYGSFVTACNLVLRKI